MSPPPGDPFSAVAADYRRFRPSYPAQLFDWLAARAPGRELAWDCATGSGQAALALAARFRRVVASDASLAQLAAADPAPRVVYLASRAEASALAAGLADLVTVAQALHWLAAEDFYREVRRAARPGALLAAWTYGPPAAAGDAGRAIGELQREVAPHWPEERRHVEAGYATLELPFDEIAAPRLELEARWTLGEMAGYAGTWSAVERYRAARGRDPVAAWAGRWEAAWGGRRVSVRWPLALRAGVVS